MNRVSYFKNLGNLTVTDSVKIFLLSFWEFWTSTCENFPVWQLELVSKVFAWKNPCLSKRSYPISGQNPTWKIVHNTVKHRIEMKPILKSNPRMNVREFLSSFLLPAEILCIFCPDCIVSFSFLTKMRNDVRARKVSHYVWWNPESEGHLEWVWS